MAPISSRRWPYAVAVLVVVGVFAASLVRWGGNDPRDVGDADDIRSLADRDDLNLFFVLIDTLRADRLSSYGYERATSPVLDWLADRGVRFDRHLAQSSWTKSSMASLWTSLYPLRAGVTRFDERIAEEAELPAEVLRRAGFRTAGLWRNGWVSGYFGFDQGFEVYERPVGRPPPASVRRENPTLSGVGTDVDLIPATASFLDVYGRERWFLYVHLMDLHEYLYDEDSALFGTSYSDVYDNAIRRTNLVVEQLLGLLVDRGLFERTIVVISSDHGEAFGERGLEGHARAVYAETQEVPWIVSLPFRLEPGVVVRSRTENVDVWPTLFALLGLETQREVDGHSRLPEILAAAASRPETEEGDPALAFLDQTWGARGAAPQSTLSVSRGPLRYVRTDLPDGRLREELFHAGRDPEEGRNLLAELPEQADELRELARDGLAQRPPWSPQERLELDEMQLNQLRALGYKVP